MVESDNVTESVKANVKNVDTWIRGLFIIIYGVIFYVLIGITLLVIIFQFLMKVLTGNLNANLMSFSAGLVRYAAQILDYLTFQSEVRPWPFGPWPEGEAVAPPPPPPPGDDQAGA